MAPRFTVTIDGESVTVRVGTLVITEAANNRNTLTCEILSLDATYRLSGREEILVDDNGTRVFGGHISVPTEHAIDGQLVDEFAISITAVDFNELAERRTVIAGGIPASFSLKAAVTSLAGFLSDYGVTVDPGQVNGPALPLMTYDIKRVSDWFDDLSVITGFIWNINYHKVLSFTEPGTVDAPFAIEDDDDHTVDDISVEPSDTDFANRIILLAGTGQQDVTEALIFNGSVDFVDLAYTLVSYRIITVNGVSENIGDSPATWGYDVGTNRLTRRTGPPAAGTGEITYTAQFPLVAIAESGADPADVVERVEKVEDVFSVDLAQALADGYLVRALAQPRTIKYASFTPGLHPGQTQPVASSKRNLDTDVLITEVKSSDLDGETVRYDITSVEGDVYPGSWRDTYRTWGGDSGATSTAAIVTTVTSGGVGGSGTPGQIAAWTTTSIIGSTNLNYTGDRLINIGAAPSYELYETDQGSNLKRWGIVARAGVLQIEKDNDTAGSPTVLAAINRSGEWTTGIWKATAVGAQWGGTGLDSHSSSGVGKVAAGVWSIGTVSAVFGGTNIDSSAQSGVPSINGGTWQVNNVLTANRLLIASASNAVTSSAGLTYTSSTLTVDNTITTPSATNLTLSPTGDLVLAPAGADVLPNVGYTINLGALTNKYLTLHAAELWVETLVAQNTIATIGGRVLVGPTNTLTVDASAGATTLTFKYNNFSNGDRIYFEANGFVEFMAVTSSAGGSAGAYTYTVTRNLDGSGANAWTAGDAAFNTGTTGNGFIDLYSVAGVLPGSTAGPTIVGNVRTGTTYNQISPRWAIGNLNGLYGYSGSTYGAAFGDPAGAWLKIDTTNGIRIGFNTTTKTQIDATGNASFVSGGLTIDETGVTIAPSTSTPLVYGHINGYTFGNTTGSHGMYAGDNSTLRVTRIFSEWTGAGNKTIQVLMRAINNPASGGLFGDAELDLQAVGGSSTADLSATTITLSGDVRVVSSVTQNTSVFIYPGSASGLTAYQTSYYLASHATWGLYSNTSLATEGFYVAAAGLYSCQGDTDTGMSLGVATNRIDFITGGSARVHVDGNGDLFPAVDGTRNCGVPSLRWGTIYAATGSINTSDARQKKAIRATAYGRDFLLALRPVDYRWLNPALGIGDYQGFLAQDVAAIDPNFGGLHFGDDGVADGLNYTAFIGPLVAGYQDHDARLRALEMARHA